MKTTFNIDDHLLAEARRLTRIDEKTALLRAIEMAKLKYPT